MIPEETKSWIDNPQKLRNIGWTIICLTVVIVLITPALITQFATYISFDSSSGAIGDSIGGTTAPITSLVGSILVFLTLLAQVRANRIIDKRQEQQEKRELYSENRATVNEVYTAIKDSIENFTYSFQGIGTNRMGEFEYSGEEAFFVYNKHTMKAINDGSAPNIHGKYLSIIRLSVDFLYLFQELEFPIQYKRTFTKIHLEKFKLLILDEFEKTDTTKVTDEKVVDLLKWINTIRKVLHDLEEATREEITQFRKDNGLED